MKADYLSDKNIDNEDLLIDPIKDILAISAAISSVVTYDDLLQEIKGKVHDLLDLSHSHLNILERNDQVYNSFISDSSKDVGAVKVDQNLIEELASAEQSGVVELNKGLFKYYQFFKLNFFEDMILDGAHLIKLIYKNEFYGWWALFYKESRDPDIIRMATIQGIADVIAVSLHNISARKMAMQREAEKKTLLSLSKDFAVVRNRSDLVQVLTKRIKKILNFSHISIGKVDIASRTMWPTMLDPESAAKDDDRYREITSSIFPLDDGYIDDVLSNELPVVFDLSDIGKSPRSPIYFKLNYANGIQQAVMAKLTCYQRITGLWALFFKQTQYWDHASLRLIQGISDQLSIAISNIEANEVIELRELERSRLLTFSTALASVQSKSDISLLMSRHLKDLCAAADYCLYWLNSDQSAFTPYLWDTAVLTREHITSGDELTETYVASDIIFNRLRTLRKEVVFKIDDECDHAECPDYMHFFKSQGVDRVIAFPMFVGQEMAGVFFANFNEILLREVNLMKGLCAQLAVTVSNIHATDKVKQHIREISSNKERLEEERIYLKEELSSTSNYADIIGESAELKKVFELVSQVSGSDSTVLILGETGTGKELVARAIHQHSPRSAKLMVKVNCAALPANLIESELFGHERGSFTGAIERRIGKFELANNATLFLDEIGELPLELQAKLLRVLQEKEIERIGGKSTIKVDVRIVTATNRNLEMEVAEGRFRSDLYYRLNIFPIPLPPLRERKEDIPLLATHFVQRCAKNAGKKITSLSKQVINELLKYSWPGNIRELEHMIERSVLLTTGTTVKVITLPSSPSKIQDLTVNYQTVKSLDENEREHIMNVLKQCRGRIGGPNGAAKLLGVPATTLSSKIKRLGIKRGFNI